MAGARKLPAEVQAFVIEQLAAWATPAEVAEAVRDRFGIGLSRQGIERYDPTKYAGRALATRWVAHFEKARDAAQTQLDRIPIAQLPYRLRRLQAIHTKAFESGNHVVALDALEQAAKDSGRMFERPENGGVFDGAVFVLTPPPTAAQRAAAERKRRGE